MDQELPETGCPNCERLHREVDAFKRETAELKARIGKLEALLEQALRRGKRQAAPFGKGPPKKKSKRPGRKPGDEFGQHVPELLGRSLATNCIV